MQSRKQTKKRRGGKKLLFLVLVLGILGFGWVHIVHGSSAAKRTHHTVAACRHMTKKQAHACLQRVKREHAQARKQSAVHTYATHLVPVLKRARSAFDGAAAAVQATDLDTLDGICNTYGSEITILSAETDGVPHPGQWYLPVPKLHRKVLGLFHDMLGALQVCQTASENGDYYSASVARYDVASVATRMRSTDDYTLWLSHRR